MIIKNTKKLVEVALAHREADHIANSGYARISGKHNGDRKENWSVCAIGCLATPATLEELKEEFPNFVSVWHEKIAGEKYTSYKADINEHILVDKLAEKYGICESLARAAEMFFEACETDEYGDSIEEEYILSKEERANWPLNFATSLNEGAEITDEMVEDYFYENNLLFGIEKYFSEGDEREFLSWLREQK